MAEQYDEESSDHLGGILEHAMQRSCAVCGASVPRDSGTCPNCQAAVYDEDEDAFSIREGGVESGGKPRIGLERSSNYRHLQSAVSRIVTGEMSDEDFMSTIRRMKQVADSGLKLINSASYQKQVGESSGAMQQLGEQLHQGFIQLQEALQLLERYPANRQQADLDSGWTMAERAFRALADIAQDSDELHEEEQAAKEAAQQE